MLNLDTIMMKSTCLADVALFQPSFMLPSNECNSRDEYQDKVIEEIPLSRHCEFFQACRVEMHICLIWITFWLYKGFSLKISIQNALIMYEIVVTQLLVACSPRW